MSILRQSFFPFTVVFISLTLMLQACVDSNEARLEQVRFLLDQGKIEEALTLATEAITDQPDNLKAQKLYAEANLTAGALSGGNNCQSTDIGFLGLIACLQDAKGAGENDFDTFRRIAPGTEAKLAQVETATNTLTVITTTTDAPTDTYLLQFFSKLFEISGVITRLGSFNQGDPCASSPSTLTTEEKARFQSNIDSVNADGVKAGLPSDFELFARIDQVRADVSMAGDLETFLDSEICN